MKNRLDEMQEQKLLKIEHNGCWLAFYGLAAVIMIQLFLYGKDFKSVAGEWGVFMCLSWFIGGSCIKNGIWDRKLSPEPKTNLKVSLIGASIAGFAVFCLKYHEHNLLWGAAASGIIILLTVFATCLAGLTLMSRLYRKRMERLENGEEETEKHGEE